MNIHFKAGADLVGPVSHLVVVGAAGVHGPGLGAAPLLPRPGRIQARQEKGGTNNLLEVSSSCSADFVIYSSMQPLACQPFI